MRKMRHEHPERRIRSLREWQRRWLRRLDVVAVLLAAPTVLYGREAGWLFLLSAWSLLLGVHILISGRIRWLEGQIWEGILFFVIVGVGAIATTLMFYEGVRMLTCSNGGL